MNRRFHSGLLYTFIVLTPLAYGADPPLIVVEDRGGTPALPYYDALQLPRSTVTEATLPADVAPARNHRFGEADVLPVRSAQLTPGIVEPRSIEAQGLRPIFLVGDDERSRSWLRERRETLLALDAVGLVVNVESSTALDELRRVARGLTLLPTSGDDIARRVGLAHYPVLITATSIEQ